MIHCCIPIAAIRPKCSKAAVENYHLANAIHAELGSLRAGSLTFYGNWFGKPYDNIHRIVGATAFDAHLVIYFDQAECLIVDGLRDWSLAGGNLLIREAERIRFQWFYYGAVPAPETLMFEEYRLSDAGPVFTTNFLPGRNPGLDRHAAAVQLHSQLG